MEKPNWKKKKKFSKLLSLHGHWSTYIPAVFRLGEVNEVVVVHVLSVEQVAVLSLAQVLWINAIGSQKLLICNAEGLTNGLSNQLSLTERKNKAYKKHLHLHPSIKYMV